MSTKSRKWQKPYTMEVQHGFSAFSSPCYFSGGFLLFDIACKFLVSLTYMLGTRAFMGGYHNLFSL